MLKIYACYKLGNNSKYTEIFPEDRTYKLFESVIYKIEYFSEEDLDSDVRIWIEDYPIADNEIIFQDHNNIKTKESRFFEDYWGDTSITIGNISFNAHVLTRKINSKEAVELVKSLFERGIELPILISKGVYNNQNEAGSKKTLSLKVLNVIDDFITAFELLLPRFINNSKSLLRDKIDTMNTDTNLVSGKSIEWLFNNLDEVLVSSDFKDHPSAFRIENTYGIAQRIAVEKKINSYNIYENQVIIEAFHKAIQLTKEIESLFKQKLSSSDLNEEELSVSSIHQIACFYAQQKCVNILRRLLPLYNKYQVVFQNITGVKGYPKITSTFIKINHYRESYKKILDIHNQQLNLESERLLFNIKKMSQLYELYVLHIIIDQIRVLLLRAGFVESSFLSTRSDGVVSDIVFNRLSTNDEIKFLYEPRIAKNTSLKTRLIRINATDRDDKYPYYEPDFVIEYHNPKFVKSRIVIIDAKYRSWESLNKDIPKLGFKYILGTGVISQPETKVEHLLLVIPIIIGRGITHLTQEGFSPAISTVTAKPKIEQFLQAFLQDLFIKWDLFK